jgi:hypothetical protein
VHDNLLTRDILENAAVSGRGAPYVVFRRQAIHRHHQVKIRKSAPFSGDRANGTGNQLYFNSEFRKLWQQYAQFAVTN